MVVRAADVKVIKAYVATGLGVAIVQRVTVDPARDTDLAIIDTGDVFPPSKAHFSLRGDHFIRGDVRVCIEMVGPGANARLEPGHRGEQ